MAPRARWAAAACFCPAPGWGLPGRGMGVLALAWRPAEAGRGRAAGQIARAGLGDTHEAGGGRRGPQRLRFGGLAQACMDGAIQQRGRQPGLPVHGADRGTAAAEAAAAEAGRDVEQIAGQGVGAGRQRRPALLPAPGGEVRPVAGIERACGRGGIGGGSADGADGRRIGLARRRFTGGGATRRIGRAAIQKAGCGRLLHGVKSGGQRRLRQAD